MGLSNARRALVVDSNPWNRRQICDVLAEKGYEVSACDSLVEGRKFYRRHPIVVAGEAQAEGEEGELDEFVAFVRESAGEAGGYVIRLAAEGALGEQDPAKLGVEDVIAPPFEREVLDVKFQKADDWLGRREALANRENGVEIISRKAVATPVGKAKTKRSKKTVKTEDETIEETGAKSAVSSVNLSPKPAEPGGGSPGAEADRVSIRKGNAVRRSVPAASPVGEHSNGGIPVPDKTSKYQYHLLIENAPLAMAMFDTEMHYLIANNSWRKRFDLEGAELIGRGHLEIFSEVSERWQLLCDRAIGEGREVVGDESVEWPDGATDWVRWTMCPWTDEDGRPAGLVVACAVITAEKASRGDQQFESGLAESLMNSGVTPLVVLDFTGRVVRCNRIARRWGDWAGSGDDRYFWDAFVPVAERQQARERFEACAAAMLEDGEYTFPPVSVEAVRADGDDAGRRVAWANTPRLGAGGVITGVVRVGVAIEDVDLPTVEVTVPARLDEEAIAELQDEWMDSFPLMCWRTNSRGKIKFFNRQWLDFRGCNALEECDNGWLDGLHEEDYDSLIHAFDTAAKTGARVNHVARMLGGDGQYRWLRFISARDFSDLEGGSDGFVGYCEDLGRIIRLENELSAARSRYDELLEDSTGAFRARRSLEGKVEELEGELVAERSRLVEEREAALAALREQLAQLAAQREADVAGLSGELDQLRRQREADVAQLGEERDQALAQVMREREAELEQLTAEREAEVASLGGELEQLRRQREADVAQLGEERDQALAQLMQEREAELEQLKAEREAEVAGLSGELEQLRRQREADLARLSEERDQALAQLTAEREADVAGLSGELEQLRRQREADLAQLMREREAELAQLGQEREAALAALAGEKDAQAAEALAAKDQRLARALDEKEVELAKVLQEKQAALAEREAGIVEQLRAAEAELLKLREESQREIEAMQVELQGRVAALSRARDEHATQHREGLASLEVALASLKGEYDGAVAERAELLAELEAERQLQSSRQAELSKLRKEIDEAQKAAAAAGSERDRFVVIPENAPFGMVLIGRDGAVLYANPATDEVAGVEFGNYRTVEDWLEAQAPTDDEEGRERLFALWREGIWRKDGTKVLSMQTGKGLRELELKSKLLPDGQLLLSMFDVTDSRRAEEALRASEVKFRSIFYDSGVGMALVDKTGNIFDANPAQERLTGYSRAELRKMHIEDCMSLEEIARSQALARKMGEARSRSGEMSIRLQPKDKRPAWAHMNVSLVRDPDGEVVFAAYFFHDITKERQAISNEQKAISNEQKAASNLADTRAEKQAIVEASPDLIVVVGPDGIVRNVVPPVSFPLHVDQAMEGRPLAEVIPPLADGFSQLAAAVAARASGVETKEFSVKQEDETFHFECRIAKSGEANTVVVIRDVTAAKQASAATRRQALTFANIRDAIIVADLKGRINDWNPAAEKMFGYTKDEAIGKGLYALYDREDPKRFKKTISTAIGKHRKWEGRTNFHRKDGSEGHCEVMYTPLLDEGGRPLALVGVTRPVEPESPLVSILQGRQESAPPAAEVAQAAGREAHLRVQQSIESLADILADQESSARLHDESRAELATGRARLQAIALLNQVIAEGDDFERINFGTYVRQLVQFALAEFGPEHAAIEVHLNVKGIVVPVAVAQPLAIILFELLSNALRHGFPRHSNGMVGVAMGIGGDSGWLVVNDDGDGLPPGFRLDAAPRGSGLQIAAQQAELIGGEIKVVNPVDTEIQVGFRLKRAT